MQLDLRAGSGFLWVFRKDFHRDQRLADTRSLCFTSEPKDECLEILDNPEINLVMTSDISEVLFSVLLKTQISRYIKTVTETKFSSDALKNFLDRFQFPVTIVDDLVNFVLILIPTP